MPGTGEIGGGSCDVSFTVHGKPTKSETDPAIPPNMAFPVWVRIPDGFTVVGDGKFHAVVVGPGPTGAKIEFRWPNNTPSGAMKDGD